MAENLQIRIPVILGTENVLSEIDKIQRTVTQICASWCDYFC